MKNILAPLAQLTCDPQNTPHSSTISPTRSTRRPLETPADRLAPPAFPIVSAMKGVILTATGESLVTPAPAKLVDILVDSPGVGQSLGFAKIFDFDKGDEENKHDNAGAAMSTPTRSPSKRRPDAVAAQTQAAAPAPRSPSKSKPVGTSTRVQSQGPAALVPSRMAPAPPAQRTSRLRRPSISSRSQVKRVEALAADTAQPEDATITTTSAGSSSSTSSSSSSGSTRTVSSSDSRQLPTYNLHDDENLPSPFLRRGERERGGVGRALGIEMEMEIEKMPRSGNGTIARVKRPSGANLLRAAAAANSAKAAGGPVAAKGRSGAGTVARSSSVVRRAGEEARKALLRM